MAVTCEPSQEVFRRQASISGNTCRIYISKLNMSYSQEAVSIAETLETSPEKPRLVSVTLLVCFRCVGRQITLRQSQASCLLILPILPSYLLTVASYLVYRHKSEQNILKRRKEMSQTKSV